MPQYITTVTAGVTSQPFGGATLPNLTGFSSGPYVTSSGSITSSIVGGHTIYVAGWFRPGSPFELVIQMDGLVTTATFTTLTVIQPTNSYISTNSLSAMAVYVTSGSTNFAGAVIQPSVGSILEWGGASASFTNGEQTTLIFQGPAVTTPIAGQGDITNPEAWQDASGNIPPLQFQNVPVNTNYPQNGDGRYWFTASADTGSTASITFIGATDFLIDTASLQATITQAANDGSAIYLTWSNGVTTGSVQLGPSLQDQSLLTSSVAVPLYATGALTVGVYANGGTAISTATPWEVAIAITRNVNESLPWDYSNPFNPIGYNAACMDNSVPTDTLADLRQRILIRLGFASQSANPTPGMILLVNDFLESAQTYLYRRYKQLHTTRLFRWKINPGQRFYSLKDNDEDAMCNFNMDPNKKIEWAGIQDSRNVWYPLVQGIPPQLYTMINKPWRPARYEIRQAIEVYPAPDQTYWMWMKGHFGLMAFTLDTNSTTLDCELVFLHALANAKAHYGQPDANNIEAQANAYRMELIAGTHQTASYIPGTIAVPPAVRPTLIQYQDNQGG
jgi:hypothetical protein